MRFWQLLPLLFLLAVPIVRAAFVETFENGSNDGDWRLTTGTNPVIEPSGGNPGAYLHGQVDAAVPTWYVPLGTTPTHFLGNYAKLGVGGMSFDVSIFAGLEVPDRAVTLNLETTFGTGDFTQGVDAYYIGQRHLEAPGRLADLLFSARRDLVDYSARLGSHARKWKERHRRRLAGIDAGRGDNWIGIGQAGLFLSLLGLGPRLGQCSHR